MQERQEAELYFDPTSEHIQNIVSLKHSKDHISGCY